MIKKGGVYTIIEVKNGLGKLKSGQGWISVGSEYVSKKAVLEKQEFKQYIAKATANLNCRKGAGSSYEVERTMDINLQAQKTPILIEGNKNTLLTLKNVYMNYSGNTPVIYGNKTFDVSNKVNLLSII